MARPAKHKIKINLFDSASWDNALREYDKYTKDFENKIALFTQRLAERGVELAKTHVLTLGATFTMDLYNSLHAVERGNMAYAIVTDCEHCAFVEFGTGQLGQEGPYPYPFPKGVTWEYNVGETIFEIDEGQYGWFYPTLDGGWKFTQGMPARPYMYETSVELATEVHKIAKEVFLNGSK